MGWDDKQRKEQFNMWSEIQTKHEAKPITFKIN